MSKWKFALSACVALLGISVVSTTTVTNVAADTTITASSYDDTVNNVGTVVRNGSLIDCDGNAVKDNQGNAVQLPIGSSWKLGKQKTINGISCIEVSYNQFADANDFLISSSPRTEDYQLGPVYSQDKTPIQLTSVVGTVVNGTAKVYNTSTKSISANRALANNSGWLIAKIVKNKDGQYFGQVSADEWVNLNSFNLNTDLSSISSRVGYIANFAL